MGPIHVLGIILLGAALVLIGVWLLVLLFFAAREVKRCVCGTLLNAMTGYSHQWSDTLRQEEYSQL